VEDDPTAFFCTQSFMSDATTTSVAALAQTTPRHMRVWSDPMGSHPSNIPGPLPPAYMSWDDVDVWTEGSRGACTLVKNVVPNVSYELWFEDSWQNNTWNDLILRFTLREGGDVEVEYIGQHTGAYHYWLRDAETDENLMPDGYMGCNATLSVGTKCLATAKGGAGPGTTSYGMNSLVKGEQLFSHGSRVILCLDYQKAIARGPTDEYPDHWRGVEWETPDQELLFARHDSRANVLFTDGSVESVDPRTFEPFNVTAVIKLWDPER